MGSRRNTAKGEEARVPGGGRRPTVTRGLPSSATARRPRPGVRQQTLQPGEAGADAAAG